MDSHGSNATLISKISFSLEQLPPFIIRTMKQFFLASLFLVTWISLKAQSPQFIEWQALTKNDISLQPEYGGNTKNTEQLASDKEFIELMLEEFEGDTIAASNKMSEVGFTYLYRRRDFKTAMKRFNQAYLLNPNNADAYYGYGTVYFNLGAMTEAREQYDKGLLLNPNHNAMLTDYGTTYLGDYYSSVEKNEKKPERHLETATKYLNKALAVDPKDSNALYKLSIVHLYAGDCKKAKQYLDKAKALENPNITPAYEAELNARCK